MGLILGLLKQLAKYMLSTFYPLVSHHYAHFKGESEKRDFSSVLGLPVGLGLGGQCWQDTRLPQVVPHGGRISCP